MSPEQEMIERAGGEYLGIVEGLAYFNDPETHTTMTVKAAALQQEQAAAVKFIKELLGMKRCAFALKAAG
jgi:hypothetical protein